MSEEYKYKRIYIPIKKFGEEISKRNGWKIIHYQEKGCMAVVILEKKYFI